MTLGDGGGTSTARRAQHDVGVDVRQQLDVVPLFCLTSSSRFGCDPLRVPEDPPLEDPLQVEEHAPAALVSHWWVRQ